MTLKVTINLMNNALGTHTLYQAKKNEGAWKKTKWWRYANESWNMAAITKNLSKQSMGWHIVQTWLLWTKLKASSWDIITSKLSPALNDVWSNMWVFKSNLKTWVSFRTKNSAAGYPTLDRCALLWTPQCPTRVETGSQLLTQMTQ